MALPLTPRFAGDVAGVLCWEEPPCCNDCCCCLLLAFFMSLSWTASRGTLLAGEALCCCQPGGRGGLCPAGWCKMGATGGGPYCTAVLLKAGCCWLRGPFPTDGGPVHVSGCG